MPDTLARERILVTGGSGFIGQHLLRALVALGSRPTATTRSLTELQVPHDLRDAVDWVKIDWLDQPAIDQVWRQERPEVLFHLAGVRLADVDKWTDKQNWDGNAQLLEDLLVGERLDGIRRMVSVGSAEEYGDRDQVLTESLPLEPVTFYGLAKMNCTLQLLFNYEYHGLPVTILRPFSVYGPGQPDRMFVAQAIAHAVSDRPFAMTEGRQRRDLVHVDDMIRALLAAAVADGVDGQVINIASGEPRPLREVAEMIWRLSGTTAELQIGARPAPPEELHDTWADISRARELLKWEPRVDLETGLRQTIDWARTAIKAD